MTQNQAETQESRTVMVGIRVTPAEKRAIELVVEVRRIDGGVSALLRDRPFSEVVEEGRQMLDRLAEMTPAERAG